MHLRGRQKPILEAQAAYVATLESSSNVSGSADGPQQKVHKVEQYVREMNRLGEYVRVLSSGDKLENPVYNTLGYFRENRRKLQPG